MRLRISIVGLCLVFACSSTPLNDKTIEARSAFSAQMRILEKDLRAWDENPETGRFHSMMAVAFANLDFLQSRLPSEENSEGIKATIPWLSLLLNQEAHEALDLLAEKVRQGANFPEREKLQRTADLAKEKLTLLEEAVKTEYDEIREKPMTSGSVDFDEYSEVRKVSLGNSHDFRNSDPLVGVQSPVVFPVAKGGRVAATIVCEAGRPPVTLTLVDLMTGQVLLSDQGKSEYVQVIHRFKEPTAVAVRMAVDDLSPWQTLACKLTLSYSKRAATKPKAWSVEKRGFYAGLLGDYEKAKTETEGEIRKLSLSGAAGITPETLNFVYQFVQNRYNRASLAQKYGEVDTLIEGEKDELKVLSELSETEMQRIQILLDRRSKLYAPLSAALKKMSEAETKLVSSLSDSLEVPAAAPSPVPSAVPSPTPSPSPTPKGKKTKSKATKPKAAPKT